MISRWIAILTIMFLSQAALAIQSYDGSRPVRNDLDNISLRLEGQHLSRTCPGLIEQKAKHVAPLVCRFVATNEKFYRKLSSRCTSPVKPCCDRDIGVTKRCMVGADTKYDFFSRLILRSKNGKFKCMWEGCPEGEYFNLSSYSATAGATAPNAGKTYTLNYRRLGELDPLPVAVACVPDVGHEQCDPDNQTLPNCEMIGCGGVPSPPPGPGA